MSKHDEVAELQSENAKLRAELHALRNPPKPLFPTLLNPMFAVPSAEQLARLQDIVLTAYPCLKPTSAQIDGFDSFLASFAAISMMPRTKDGGLNLKYDRMTYIQRAETICQQLQIPGDITVRGFTAAIIASGDVSFAITVDRFPSDSGYGLADFHGVAATGEGWMNLLNGKSVIRKPLPLPATHRGPPVVDLNMTPKFYGGAQGNVGEVPTPRDVTHYRI